MTLIIGGFHIEHVAAEAVNISKNHVTDHTHQNILKRTPPEQNMVSRPWEVVIGLICVSFLFWENFVEKNLVIKLCGTLVTIPMAAAKARNHVLRQKTAVLTSVWKSGIILAFPYLFFTSFKFEIYTDPDGHGREVDLHEALKYHLPAIVMILSALVVYYFAGLACKLKMQRFSFSLPLTLATPVTLLCIFLQCQLHSPDHKRFVPGDSYSWLCLEEQAFFSSWKTTVWQAACCVAWWVSQLVITAYIWRPMQNRMEKREM